MVQRCSGEKKRNPSAGLSGKGGFYRMKTRSDKEEEKAKRGTFTPGLSLQKTYWFKDDVSDRDLPYLSVSAFWAASPRGDKVL